MGRTIRTGAFDIYIWIETRDGHEPGPYVRVSDANGNCSEETFDSGLVTVEEGRAIYAAALRRAAEEVERPAHF